MENQTVLDGDLRRCILGDAAADAISLDKQIGYTGLFQKIGTEQPCDSTTDNQYIGFCVLF